MSGGEGTFVKREGTTADKLDFSLARAHVFEFSSMCQDFTKLFMQETIENIEKNSGKCGFISVILLLYIKVMNFLVLNNLEEALCFHEFIGSFNGPATH